MLPAVVDLARPRRAGAGELATSLWLVQPSTDDDPHVPPTYTIVSVDMDSGALLWTRAGEAMTWLAEWTRSSGVLLCTRCAVPLCARLLCPARGALGVCLFCVCVSTRGRNRKRLSPRVATRRVGRKLCARFIRRALRPDQQHRTHNFCV